MTSLRELSRYRFDGRSEQAVRGPDCAARRGLRKSVRGSGRRERDERGTDTPCAPPWRCNASRAQLRTTAPVRPRCRAPRRGGPRRSSSTRRRSSETSSKTRSAPSARDADGCASFSDRARRAIRDHLLGFPDDPLNRAAHRLERVLPTYLVRLVLADERINLRRLARDLQAHWSDDRAWAQSTVPAGTTHSHACPVTAAIRSKSAS
jgi:hypothetical protein